MVNVIRKQDNIVRKTVCMLIFSLIVSFCFVAGKIYDTELTDSIFSVFFVKKYIFFVLFFFTTLFFSCFIYTFIKSNNDKKRVLFIKSGPSKRLVCLLPLCCYAISLLSIFPGIFSYDCWQEWDMIEKGMLSSHHPVLHVLILGGFTSLSNYIFGSGNVGIFLYVSLQIFFFLIVFRYIFLYMDEKGTSPLSQWTALCFVSLSPIINLFVLATSKDSLFAIFELLFAFESVRLYKEKSYLEEKKNVVIFLFASLGTMIFRNNGLYIVVLTNLIMLFLCKGRRLKLLIPYAIIGVIYLAYTGPFYNLLSVEAGSKREMLSVPIQQLARVHQYDFDDFTKNELNIMYSVIDKENWNQYVPTCADAVKNGFDDEAFSKAGKDFLKIWVKHGINHPATYANAFLINTVDYWYPLAVNDNYAWLYGKDEKIGDFFDYRVAEPGNEVVIIKPLHDFYYYISTDLLVTSKIIPALFLNPGVYLLLWIACMFWDIANKITSRAPIHIVLLFNFWTVLLGPMVQVRYIVVLYFIVPLWFMHQPAEC